MLRVNEIFGPTIQGEGPATGRNCLFVRLSHCNLYCNWCDTPYTWAWSRHKAEKHRDNKVYELRDNTQVMSSDDVIHRLAALWPIRSSPTMVVISGGEPLLQAEQLEELAGGLLSLGHKVHIETAGTVAPTDLLFAVTSLFVVSPKLWSSGNAIQHRRIPEVLDWFAGAARSTSKVWFKFVITRDGFDLDISEVAEYVTAFRIPNERVMLMPEGITSTDIIEHGRRVADAALSHDWGVSLRQHVLLWDNKRGV